MYDDLEEEKRIIETSNETYNENTGEITRTTTRRKGNKSATIIKRGKK